MGINRQHLLDGRSTRALVRVSLDGGPAAHLEAGLSLITWLKKKTFPKSVTAERS